MPNFSRFLDWRFWFSMKPGALGERTMIVIIVVFAVFMLAALIFRFLVKVKKQNPPLVKVFKKFYKMLFTMALVGFFLLFLAYEQIYLLGAHFWFLVWFLGLLAWTVFIVRHMIVRMPKEREALEQKKRFEKYLPR